MRILCMLLAAFACYGQVGYRSLVAQSGSCANGSVPNDANYSGITAVNLWFRIKTSATSGRIAAIGFTAGDVLINAGSGVISAAATYAGGSTTTVPYVAGTDVIVHWHHSGLVSPTTRGQYIEAWTADGKSYVMGQWDRNALLSGSLDMRNQAIRVFDGGAGNCSSGIANGEIAWMRLYKTSIGPDSTATGNAATGSPLLRYEFENAVTAAAGPDLTAGASNAYSNTAATPWVGEKATVRAGASIVFDLSGSAADSYETRCVQVLATDSPCAGVNVASASTATPTVSGMAVSGEYRFRVRTTTTTGSATADKIVGVVASNAANVVIPPTQRLGVLLAPMLRSDSGPWAFYDKNRRRLAETRGAGGVALAMADVSTPLAGTVSVPNGSATVTGVGTSFLTQYDANATIIIYRDHGGGKIGRTMAKVASVASNTSLTLTANWSYASQTNVSHQRFGSGDGGDAVNRWTDSLNYYDMVLSHYISYYKTGHSDIASYADQMAWLWWLYMDRGTSNMCQAPRIVAWTGTLIAAERGIIDATEAYNAADAWAWSDCPSNSFYNYVATRNTAVGGYQNFYYGPRESGYAWWYALLLGVLHPDESTRNAWTSRINTYIQTHLRDFQCKASNPTATDRCRAPEGAFRAGNESWAPGIAEQAWHTAIIMQGLIRYHRATGHTVVRDIILDWATYLITSTQPGASGTGAFYQIAVPSSFGGINCRRHFYWQLNGSETTPYATGGHAGDGCAGGFDAVAGGRDLNNEMVSTYGYAQRLTANPTHKATFKTLGDDMFGATWGADDSYYGQWVWTGATNLYKTYAQGTAINDSYLVDRLDVADADTSAIARTVRVGFSLAAVSGAADIRVTLTKPNGETVTAICSSSPCEITADARQGAGAFVLEYRNGSGVVIARGERTPISVQ